MTLMDWILLVWMVIVVYQLSVANSILRETNDFLDMTVEPKTDDHKSDERPNR